MSGQHERREDDGCPKGRHARDALCRRTPVGSLGAGEATDEETTETEEAA